MFLIRWGGGVPKTNTPQPSTAVAVVILEERIDVKFAEMSSGRSSKVRPRGFSIFSSYAATSSGLARAIALSALIIARTLMHRLMQEVASRRASVEIDVALACMTAFNSLYKVLIPTSTGGESIFSLSSDSGLSAIKSKN